MSETDKNDEIAEMAQLLHQICYDAYVRLPQVAVKMAELHAPHNARLLEHLRCLVRPDKAETCAIQIACCMKTALPAAETEGAGPPLDFESYLTTSPDEFKSKEPSAIASEIGIAQTKKFVDTVIGPPLRAEADIPQASAMPCNDEIVMELEELLQ